MRLLMFHVDSFTCTITEKGRSPLVETPTSPSAHIDAGLLVLASVEAGDEEAPGEVASGAGHEVERLARQLRVTEVMLLPFAHLFAEPAPVEGAVQVIEATAASLQAAGLSVQRPPFGWFHSWDLKAKGHPLSRVARTVRPKANQANRNARQGREPGRDVVVELPLRLQAQPGGPTPSANDIFPRRPARA